jgi:DNA-binding NarL/FixJ family response regulator
MRVFICSSIRLYREGIASALERTTGLDVAGTGATTAECIGAVAARRVEVVLLDASAPGAEESVRGLRALSPALRVVVLTAPEGEQEVMALAEAGAAAFVTRDDALSDLTTVLSGLRRGEAPLSPRMTGMLLRRVAALAAERPERGCAQAHGQLTRRELEIVGLLAEGLSNKQIGARLQIELATVKNHVHNILEKLGVERRSQAVAVARAHGIDVA